MLARSAVLVDMPRGACLPSHLSTLLFFLLPLQSRSACPQSDFLTGLPALWPAPAPPHQYVLGPWHTIVQ